MRRTLFLVEVLSYRAGGFDYIGARNGVDSCITLLAFRGGRAPSSCVVAGNLR